MSKRIALLLVITGAVVASGVEPRKNWTEVSSSHFTVITDAGEVQGRRIAVHFERMRAILREAYPRLESNSDFLVVILAIKDKKEFRALEPASYLEKGSLTLHGFFLRASEKNYILMRLDAEGGNPYAIVNHEYTHFLLSVFGESMPLWLNEGLAEFYESTEIYNRDIVLGKPNQQHLLLLREETLLPLAELFIVDRHSPYYLDKKKGSLFYAESWALTHYLAQRDYTDGTSKIANYVQLTSDKNDPVAAGTRTFGDLKKLQSSLQAYVNQTSFRHFQTTMRQADDLEFNATPISATEADAAKADFLAQNGRTEEADLLVKDVLRKNPNDIWAQETKAFVKLAAEERQEEELRSAIAGEFPSAAAYDRLAFFLWDRSKHLEEASALEAKAIELAPDNVEYRIHLAKILLARGNSKAAVDVLQHADGLAKNPDEQRKLEHLLTETVGYASTEETPKPLESHTADVTTAPRSEDPQIHDRERTQTEVHRLIVGTIKAVHCDSANLDLVVVSSGKTVSMHAENYYKIEFTARFSMAHDLNPCEDLENRPAKVEYVEPTRLSDRSTLIAVELRK